MQRKVWLFGAMAAAGAAMLISASFVGTAAGKTSRPLTAGQKKGGTLNVNMSATDVDYIDPALAYGTNSWQILDAVCAKLTYYPRQAGSARGQARPRRCRRFPRCVEGRQDLHLHDQERHQVQHRSDAHRRELRLRDQPSP